MVQWQVKRIRGSAAGRQPRSSQQANGGVVPFPASRTQQAGGRGEVSRTPESRVAGRNYGGAESHAAIEWQESQVSPRQVGGPSEVCSPERQESRGAVEPRQKEGRQMQQAGGAAVQKSSRMAGSS